MPSYHDETPKISLNPSNKLKKKEASITDSQATGHKQEHKVCQQNRAPRISHARPSPTKTSEVHLRTDEAMGNG